MNISITPSVGVARLGNSEREDFILNPTKIGGLPYECHLEGQDNRNFGLPKSEVTNFKDPAGRVRRQGQVFKIYDDSDEELTLDSPNIEKIVWTVHLANKKAAWYEFRELNGNLLYGEANSYDARDVPFRNKTESNRQSLIIDPGPRTIAGRAFGPVEFDQSSVPESYKHASFPNNSVTGGELVTSLGTLFTDAMGRLIVLGGYGKSGGTTELEGYGGGDGWHDDISDGSVTAFVKFNDGTTQTLEAWVVIGSPNFAPEIVNISTLSDTMFDVGVRHFDLVPELFTDGKYDHNFIANFNRDIKPIIDRMSQYQWVANVQSMSAFFCNQFDYRNNSERNKPQRQKYYQYFRQLDKTVIGDNHQPQQELFDNPEPGGLLPLMPLNSGSNSVSSANAYSLEDNIVQKFLALDETQMFMLKQWADGKFNHDDSSESLVNPMNQASVGNCVGLPMCPGIEVTWNLQNKNVYCAPYQIKHHQNALYYAENGLDPKRDECEGGGCEPGDLTKRMACPWQADFFNCTIQEINFTQPEVNKAIQNESTGAVTQYSWEGMPSSVEIPNTYEVTLDSSRSENGQPLPPTYFSYWWPPQSPWNVLAGEFSLEGQLQNHVAAGKQVNYARGLNSYSQMIEHWSALAFIRDRNVNNEGFPYFTETERNNELFEFKSVKVGQITGNPQDNETEFPIFFINDNREFLLRHKTVKGKKMAEYLEQRAFKPVKTKNIQPRSGTKLRG